jgi:DNA-binding beta-propeller fold protein YncE
MRFAALFFLLAAGYHVTETISVGGEGGWDYLAVDSAAHRLYVSHATKVVVVDLDSNKVAGEIPETPGVHGIAVASELNRGFISAGRANRVIIFDLKTLKTVGDARTGENPDAVLYEPTNKRVFAFNGRTNNATVLDAKSGNIVTTIQIGGKPEFAVADGKGTVFVNVEDTGEMAVIDAAKMTVAKRYKLEGCEEPSGLAIDTAHRRLFSVCRNKVMIVSDPDSGKVMATLPIGQGADGAGFDAGRRLAFSSNGEGTLTVVKGSGSKYEVAETAQTARGARTMAVDEKTHKLYLPTAEFAPATGAGRPAAKPGTFKILVVAE